MSFKGFDRQTYIVDSAKAYGSRRISKREFLRRMGVAGIGFSVAALERLKALAARQQRNGRPLAEDPLFAARMARVEIDLDNMKTTNLRVISAVAGGGAPGAESSMLKIRGTQIESQSFIDMEVTE